MAYALKRVIEFVLVFFFYYGLIFSSLNFIIFIIQLILRKSSRTIKTAIILKKIIYVFGLISVSVMIMAVIELVFFVGQHNYAGAIPFMVLIWMAPNLILALIEMYIPN